MLAENDDADGANGVLGSEIEVSQGPPPLRAAARVLVLRAGWARAACGECASAIGHLVGVEEQPIREGRARTA